MQNQSSVQNHSPTQKYKDSFNFFQRRRFSAQSRVLPPSRILGQKAHFPRPGAPTVPDFGTEGAFSPPKCSHRPGFWDRRRIFPARVLPPSRILGQKARFPGQSAPTVPDFGTEGSFQGRKAQFPQRYALIERKYLNLHCNGRYGRHLV